mgnify:CR=1 FL=1
MSRNTIGFNSSIGILSVRTKRARRRLSRLTRFNSSIGILSVRTWPVVQQVFVQVAFQFLDRNSFGSDCAEQKARGWKRRMFQFLDRNSFGSDTHVSGLNTSHSTCFNSSIGILSVRTCCAGGSICTCYKVSIPRSEFFRFGHDELWRVVASGGLFQFLDRNSFGSDL